MQVEQNIQWRKAVKLVKIYSYITILAVLYGILAAHLPFIIGQGWQSCDNCSSTCACVLTYHLYEVPLLLYNLYLAYYGLKRFTKESLNAYMSLINFAVSINIAFFTFEIVLLLDNYHTFAPAWEDIALASVAIILMGGSFLGIYVKQKLLQLHF